MKRTSALFCFILSAFLFGLLSTGVRPVLGEEAAEPKETAEPKEAAEPKEEQETPKAKEAKGPKVIPLDGWVSEDEQYTNPIEVEVAEEDGKKQLKVTFKGGEKDKSVVCKTVDKLKLPGDGTFRFRVSNPTQKALEVTIALKTGKAWTFHESQRIGVKPNGKEFQEIAIDLTGSTFKSEKTEWKNTGTIADAKDIRTLQFGVYNGKDDGSLTITDMEVAPKE